MPISISKSTSYISNTSIEECLSDLITDTDIDIKFFESKMDYLRHIKFNPIIILLSRFAFIDSVGTYFSSSFSVQSDLVKMNHNQQSDEIEVFVYNMECFNSSDNKHKLEMVKLQIISTIVHEIIHNLRSDATEDEVLKLEKEYMENNFKRICDILQISSQIRLSDLDECSICSEE